MKRNPESSDRPPAGTFGHIRRREYSEVEPGRRRDVDAVQRAHLIKIMGWSALGAFPGLALGFRLSLGGGSVLWIPFLAVAFPLLVAAVAYLLVSLSGRGASTLHNPSGASSPFKRQHSAAEALRVRGESAAAVEAFERAAEEYPDDARPLIEIARIQRDELADPTAAAGSFRRALQHPAIEPGQLFLVSRELCELYTHRLGEPRKALPVLARMAETRAGTPMGDWAAKEMDQVKAMVFGEDST